MVRAIPSIKKNIFLSVFVQIISMMVSFIINLIVPRYIPELEYSYWQAYVLYSSYVGVMHFGLLDGIVLRYSQYDYEELDKPRIRSQFKMLLYLNFSMCVLFVFLSQFLAIGEMKLILVLASVSIITKNLFTYTSYMFQITNQIRKYAVLVISQRLFFGVFTALLLFLHTQNFYLFCIADLCADLFGCLIGYFYNKDLYFGSVISWKDMLSEFNTNIKSGVLLLIANWSSMLVVGSAKMLIQLHWDDLIFGKVSFSFSLSNLFLTFITAISVVLFPSLRRMNPERLPKLYQSIRNMISPLLFFAMLLYFPSCMILDLWLPNYHDSLIYLGILLPVIIYTSKVSLLTNNYLKAYRKEKKMLIVNVISVVVALIIFVLSSYLLDNLTLMLISVVLVIMGRSIASEVIVMKLIGKKFFKEFIIEGIMSLIFIISARFFDLKFGFAIYLSVILVYVFFNKDMILSLLNDITLKFKGSKGNKKR